MFIKSQLKNKFIFSSVKVHIYLNNSQAIRDKYRDFERSGMRQDLVFRYIENQAIIMSPICPHLCEHIWNLIGKVILDIYI